MSKLQPAVKKETMNVFLYTAIGTILSLAAFFGLNKLFPEDIPFDYTVVLAAAGGLTVAVLNFFLMALTVTKIAAEEDEENARKFMKYSYSRRIAMQLVWIIIALAVPVFYWVTGILPLLFPSAGIKIKGIIQQRKYNRQEVEQ